MAIGPKELLKAVVGVLTTELQRSQAKVEGSSETVGKIQAPLGKQGALQADGAGWVRGGGIAPRGDAITPD
jgi:hypothetical protein